MCYFSVLLLLHIVLYTPFRIIFNIRFVCLIALLDLYFLLSHVDLFDSFLQLQYERCA